MLYHVGAIYFTLLIKYNRTIAEQNSYKEINHEYFTITEGKI